MKSFLPSTLRALRSLPFVAFRRSRVLATLAAITFSQPAQAILDTNANLLSDLWEKQHNNGNLFAPTILAKNDEDLDGWTNTQEAAAGTDPFNPNPPDGIVTVNITPSLTSGAFTLTWPTLVGKNYQLKVSTDLTTWSDLGEPITTNQTTHSIGINTIQPDTTIPPKVFWRIVVSDLDTDGDGLTDAEEHILATNPLLADSDFDGLTDMIEMVFGTDPILADTDSDGVSDYDEPVGIEWFGWQRGLTYGHTLSASPQDNYTLGITKSWLQGSIETETFEFPIPFADLDDELENRATWPNSPSSMMHHSEQKAEGQALIIPELNFNGNNTLYTLLLNADLNHTKSVVRLNRPCEHEIEILSIIQHKRRINENLPITEYSTQNIVIPAGATESNPLEMKPYFNSGGVELIAHDEKVEDKQFNLYFEVPVVRPNGYPDTKWKIPGELKVGKMQGGSAIEVSNVGTPQESAYMYLETDADKFRIILEDITETAQSVEVFLETSNTDLAYSDAGQWINLTKDGKRWISKSQLLVSNTFDDQYTQAGDDEIGVDESPTDRTHLVALDSAVKIAKVKIDQDEVTTSKELQVKTKGTITLDIVNMKQGDAYAASDEQIAQDVKTTKECYAQVGVKIIAEETEIKNVPEGIDIFDNEGILLDIPVTDHPDGNILWEYDITPELQSIINALQKPYANKVVIAYVRKFTAPEEDDGGEVIGHSIQKANYRDPVEAQYTHINFMGRITPPLGKYGATHEMSHIAGNLQHEGVGNIMSLRSFSAQGTKISDEKRFNKSQEDKIHAERFFTPIPNP